MFFTRNECSLCSSLETSVVYIFTRNECTFIFPLLKDFKSTLRHHSKPQTSLEQKTVIQSEITLVSSVVFIFTRFECSLDLESRLADAIESENSLKAYNKKLCER